MSLLWYFSGAFILIYSVIRLRFRPMFITQTGTIAPSDLLSVLGADVLNQPGQRLQN